MSYLKGKRNWAVLQPHFPLNAQFEAGGSCAIVYLPHFIDGETQTQRLICPVYSVTVELWTKTIPGNGFNKDNVG